MKYDVFISYSRLDYVDEHEVVKADSPVKAILDFLDAHQISCWFDKEGIYKGSEFVEVIANAIADSKMMLFVSSERSNGSIYTAGEIFEAIENNKLIIPIKIDGSKYNKKFKLLLNPLDYIDFSKNDALTDLLKAVENEKVRIAKIEADEALRREELKKREWKKSVKHEIQEQANELQKLKETRNALLESIYKKLRSIDITQKQCPVCESKVDIEVDYCQVCGWFFPSLSEIEGMDVEVDKSALILAHSRWEKKEKIEKKGVNGIETLLQKEIKNLKLENKRLLEELVKLEKVREQQSVVGDSGDYAPSESDLKKWNWGAFCFSWIWGFSNGIIKESLIVLFLSLWLGPIVNLYLGWYGTRLTWKYKKWSSWKSYQEVQSKWITASYLLLYAIIILLYCSLFLYDK